LTQSIAAAVRPSVRIVGRTPAFVVGASSGLPAAVALVRGDQDLGLPAVVAAVVGGAALGFAVDDPADGTYAASPTTPRARLALRAVPIAAGVGAAWLVVACWAAVAGADTSPRGLLVAEAVASAGLAVVFGRLAARSGLGGGLAAAVATVLAVATVSLLATRIPWLPVAGRTDHVGRWSITALGAWLLAVPLTRDPPRR
jgi:hypothetical protein